MLIWHFAWRNNFYETLAFNYDFSLVGVIYTRTFASTARGRAAVARRAHNPKVIGSIPVLATSAEKASHF